MYRGTWHLVLAVRSESAHTSGHRVTNLKRLDNQWLQCSRSRFRICGLNLLFLYHSSATRSTGHNSSIIMHLY